MSDLKYVKNGTVIECSHVEFTLQSSSRLGNVKLSDATRLRVWKPYTERWYEVKYAENGRLYYTGYYTD